MSVEIKAGSSYGMIKSGGSTDWDIVRNGQSPTCNTTTPLVAGVALTIYSLIFTIWRAFMWFDLSDIPFGVSIPNASLKLYSKSVLNSLMHDIVITKGYQSDPVVIGDFDLVAPYTQRDEVTDRGRRNAGDFKPIGAYFETTLNAAGLSMVEAACGGTLLICLRSSWDVEDTPDLVQNIGSSYVSFGLPTTEGQEPYLLIPEYSIDYPSHDLTRVTGIRHICRPGSYRLEATLGDVSTSVELPQRDVRIPSVTPTKEVKPEKAVPLKLPEKTVSELVEALVEEGASADVTAQQRLEIRAGILEDVKPLSQEDLERIRRTIGYEAPPEPSLWQKLTPWKEEKGETFGTAFTSTFRRGFGEVAKLGEMYKRFFGGRFG